MKLIRHYELEMTDKELRAFQAVPREGGLSKVITDLVLGKEIPEDEDEDYQEESEDEE